MSAPIPWTCPFCPLLCDGFSIAAPAGGPLALHGSDCPRARQALQQFAAPQHHTTPRIDGQPTTQAAALDTAAALLLASRQPLFGGLGTDIDGARALYPLACAVGAISDPASGDTLMHTLRALQDRGQFTTTIAEVRNRADLIVCLGGSPRDALPEIWHRIGIGEPLVAEREVVFLGAAADTALHTQPGVRTVEIAPQGVDLFDLVALLAARVAQRRIEAPSAIVALAERLHAARYAVLMLESARLPVHGSLIVETLNLIVSTLNRSTRAGVLPLGGGYGAASVNQVHTWLSGLPLRSRAGPLGLEHEPLRHATAHLLAERGVDTLLWIASYGNEPPRPDTTLPTIVLGAPGVAAPARGVFLPVATPGINGRGHLIRTDSTVVLPLDPVRDDGLPDVAELARALTLRVHAQREGSRP